jgi:antagonist of KipI
MSIRVIKAGMLDSFQDGGRYGCQHWGINPGGAMDIVALQVANILVGNAPLETALEMHFPAAELLFEHAALIALSGAEFTAVANDVPVTLNKPVVVAAGTTLRFLRREKGARVYLAAAGGFRLQRWLGSSGTNLKVQAGGMGRRLLKDDSVLANETVQFAETQAGPLSWQASVSDLYPSGPIQFITGAEYDWLDSPGKLGLEQELFNIEAGSDRMGYRLRGKPVTVSTRQEMLSTAVTRGTMQLLPDGQLIVLMADHQTTGGYPRAGHVITAHQPSLAQLGPGEAVQFSRVSNETALAALEVQQRNLQQLQNACTFKLKQYFSR